MGRFYKTSEVAPMDYMHTLDIPLMSKVIDANDQYITGELGQAGAIADKAYYDHTTQDTDAAQKINDYYTGKVNDITKAIQLDPSKWRDQLSNISSLKQDLLTNYRTGDISKQIDNYQRRKQAFDEADKQADLWHKSGGTKGTDPLAVQMFKNSWDKNFTGTKDPTTGAYNVYQGGVAPDNVDFHKVMSQGLDKLKAEVHSDITSTPDGKFWLIDEHGQKTSEISPERVLMAGLGNLSPSMINGLKEFQKVGYVSPDLNIDPNKAFSYNSTPISPEEQAYLDQAKKKIAAIKDPTTKQSYQEQLDQYTNNLNNRKQLSFDDNNYFSPILKGLIGQYSTRSVESSDKLHDWKMPGTVYTQGQENYRQDKQLTQAKNFHNDEMDLKTKTLNQRILEHTDAMGQKDEDQAEKVREFDNPHSGVGGLKGLGKGIAPTTPTSYSALPDKTGVSIQGTRSFESWMTRDANTNKDVPVLSNAGLSADIDNLNGVNSVVTSRLNQINQQIASTKDEATKADLISQKQQLEDRQKKIQSDLDNRRQWYGASVNAALTGDDKAGVKLNKDQVQLYKEFDNDRDASKLQGQINNLRSQFDNLNGQAENLRNQDAIKNKDKIASLVQQASAIKPQIEQLQKHRSDYLDVKPIVDKGRDNWLNYLKSDVINSDAVQLSGKDSQDVAQLIAGHSSGLQIFDDNGDKVDGKTISAGMKGLGDNYSGIGADKYNMGFDNLTNNNGTVGGLMDYINKYGVKIVPQMVGGSTAIGNGGGVIKVTFDDPTGRLPKNKPFYIEMNEGLQSDLSSKFTDSKKYGEDVAKVATNLGDPMLNNLRKQILTPSIADKTGADKEPGVQRVTIPDRQGNKHEINVTKFADGHLYVTYNDNGVVRPFPILSQDGKPMGMQGNFSNIDELNNQIKLQMH